MNFIPDPVKALREMVRVTRSGGVIAAAIWDYGEGMQIGITLQARAWAVKGVVP